MITGTKFKFSKTSSANQPRAAGYYTKFSTRRQARRYAGIVRARVECKSAGLHASAAATLRGGAISQSGTVTQPSLAGHQ
eukprot:SAG31_NODE_22718_length_519_cov_1.130952_1_plen_79_part_01